MRAGFSQVSRIGHLVTRAARWWPRDRRHAWLIAVALAIVVCAEAIAIPAKRPALGWYVIGLVGLGLLAARRQRQARERAAALAARLATLSHDDIPADVIELVAAGQKIHAIKRYRDLTGMSLREAKDVIDSL